MEEQKPKRRGRKRSPAPVEQKVSEVKPEVKVEAPKVEQKVVRPKLPQVSFSGKNFVTLPIQCSKDGETRHVSSPVMVNNVSQGDSILLSDDVYPVALVIHRDDGVKEYMSKPKMVQDGALYAKSKIDSGKWALRP